MSGDGSNSASRYTGRPVEARGMREGVLRIMRDDDPKAVEEFVKGLRAAH